MFDEVFKPSIKFKRFLTKMKY